MNEFRERILGRKPLRDPLLRSKSKSEAAPSRAAEGESLAELAIPREQGRQSNHRDADRHRLTEETVELVHEGTVQRVTLINLSGGGAMIEGASDLKLWDRVELRFSEWSRVEAAVRWVRGQRIGLEFAHETRVEAGDEELTAMLRNVIQRSFPYIDAGIDLRAAETSRPAAELRPGSGEAAEQQPRDSAEREFRHPLIWSGQIHYNHESLGVRLRNISSGGALVDCAGSLPQGAELLLDLGDAGTIFATVHWSHGETVGLKFHAVFDVMQLAAARPDVAAAQWLAPDYLRAHTATYSPWASQWGRSNVHDLQRKFGLSED